MNFCLKLSPFFRPCVRILAARAPCCLCRVPGLQRAGPHLRHIEEVGHGPLLPGGQAPRARAQHSDPPALNVG